jgi:hypothetical protein
VAHPRTRDGPGGGKIRWDCVSLDIFLIVLECFGVPANPRIMNVDFVFSFLGFWRVRILE